MAAHVHGCAGGALDVGVVHADELAVAGGAYGNFDGEGAAAYGLCVGVGGVLRADVAGTAVGDEEFIGLVERLMCGGAAVYYREAVRGCWLRRGLQPTWSMRAAGARVEAPMKPRRLRFLEIFRIQSPLVVLFIYELRRNVWLFI